MNWQLYHVPSLTNLDKPVKRTLLLSYFEGSAVAVYSAITVGIYPVGLALLLGANDFQVGLLGAFSFLASVFGFLAALIVESTGARKLTTMLGGIVGRIFWLVVVPLPFLQFDTNWKIGVFLAVAALSTVSGAISGNAWLAWFTDLVPQDIRGRYFGKRFGVVSSVNLLASIGAGVLLDFYKSHGAEAMGYAILLSVAVFFAICSFVLFLFHHEGPRPQPKGLKQGLGVLITPLKNKGFLVFLIYFVIWSFINGLSSPFWAAHMFGFLSMSYIQVSVYTGIAGLFVLAFQWLWGWVMDRTGARPVLRLCSMGVVITPLLWLIASPSNLAPIWTDAALSGLFWPGVNLASLYLVMENKGESGDSVFALFSFATGLASFLAGLLGAYVAQSLQSVQVFWHGLFFNNLTILFLSTAVMRGIVVAFMPGFSETKHGKTRHVPLAILSAALNGVNNLFKPRAKPL